MALRFLVTAILARLLAPEDFGLLGLTTVFVGFAAVFADLGLNVAVVQKRNITDSELDSVFRLNAYAGILLALVVAIGAPFIAVFYHEPRLRGITLALAGGFVVTSLGMVPGSLLQRNMEFRRLAYVEVASATASGILGVCMAYRGAGVYSLVAMSLGGQITQTALLWLAVPLRPRLGLSISGARELVIFGFGLLGFNILNYWLRNADNLLVGKVCGPRELAIYSLAYSLLLFPVYQIQGILGRVMLPALAARQESAQDVRRTYLHACGAIALVMFPLMAGLAVVADDFVLTVYGPKWVSAIPVVRVLAIAGMGNSVATTVGWLYTAMGRTSLMFKWALLSAPVFLSSYAIGVRWGALGVASAYTIGFYAILWYPMWRIAGGVAGLRFPVAMRALYGPLAASMAMVAAVLVIRMVYEHSCPTRLFLSVGIGIGAYWSAVHAFGVGSYLDVKSRLASVLA